MNKTFRHGLIAVGVGGGLFLALQVLTAVTPGLDIGVQAILLPVMIGGGLFAALNAMAGNRKLATASRAEQAQALSFPVRPGEGYVVLIRRNRAVRQLGFDMMLDGGFATQLMPGQFAILPVAAGRHSVFADIPGAAGKSAVAPKDVVVAEGAPLFFETRTSLGLTRTSVHLDPIEDTPAIRRSLEGLGLVAPTPVPANA